jgi:hypothetical protein
MLFFLVLGYQNCGDVSLSNKEASQGGAASFYKVTGDFCTSLDPTRSFSLQHFYVLNLTARASRVTGRFTADSDMDGISDEEEVNMFGLNPLRRRTFGLLDSVCAEAGLVGCDVVEGDALTLGLKTSDLENQLNSGVYGEDQDQDGIPDLVELLFGTLVNFPDADVASSGPSREKNVIQIKKGMAPRTPLDDQVMPDSLKIQVEYGLNGDLDCGAGNDAYSFQVGRLPVLPTLAFSSSDEPYLSHEANVNMILFLVVSVSSNGNQEISYVLRPIQYPGSSVNIQIQKDDFRLISDF